MVENSLQNWNVQTEIFETETKSTWSVDVVVTTTIDCWNFQVESSAVDQPIRVDHQTVDETNLANHQSKTNKVK